MIGTNYAFMDVFFLLVGLQGCVSSLIQDVLLARAV